MATLKVNKNYKKPIVGLLFSKAAIKNFISKQFPISLVRYEKANEKANLTLYYFSIDDINVKKKLINGTYFNKLHGKWEKKLFPYPNVIYRRYRPSPTQKKLFNTFEDQLTELNTKSLNYPAGFNKWEVYQSLSKYQELLPYLPSTILYNSPKDLEEMLHKFGCVYLKACRGGRGKQVICITQLPKGGYTCSYYVNQLYSYKYREFKALLGKILDFYQKRPFIIQEAIDLIKVDNCLVDLRPELQRDGKGEVILAALPVRIGNPNAPITTHASSYSFEYFFENFTDLTKTQIETLKNHITIFLKTLYICIEDTYGPCGEMGIDIGLDKNYQIWFIECNSRSRKVSFFKAYDEATIDRSYLNFLEYTDYRYHN